MAFEDEISLKLKLDPTEYQRQIGSIEAQAKAARGMSVPEIAKGVSDAMMKDKLEALRIDREMQRLDELKPRERELELRFLEKKLAYYAQIKKVTSLEKDISSYNKQEMSYDASSERNQRKQWRDNDSAMERQAKEAAAAKASDERKSAKAARNAEKAAGIAAKKQEAAEKDRTKQTLGTIGAVGSSVGGALQQSGYQGYTGSSVLNLAGAAMDQMGPYGQAFSFIPKLVGNDLKQIEERKEMRFAIWKKAGQEGYNTFDASEKPGRERAFYEQLGLDPGEKANLVAGSAAAGVKSQESLRSLGGLEGIYGLGKEGTQTLAAGRHGGLDDKQATAMLGNAVALGMQTGLEKGRFGEAFQLVNKSMEEATHGLLNVTTALGVEKFIGGMGAGYQGGSAAGAQAQSVLSGITSGAYGGASNVLALQAEMRFDPDLDPFGAKMRAARPIKERDPRVINFMVDELVNQKGVSEAIASGNKGKIDTAISHAAMLLYSDMPAADQNSLIDIAKRRLAGGAGADIEAGGKEVQAQGLEETAKLRAGAKGTPLPEDSAIAVKHAQGKRAGSWIWRTLKQSFWGDDSWRGEDEGKGLLFDSSSAESEPAPAAPPDVRPAPAVSLPDSTPVSTPSDTSSSSSGEPAPLASNTTTTGVNGRIEVFIFDGRTVIKSTGSAFGPPGMVSTTGNA